MESLTKNQQIEKSYDYITNIFTKQGRVIAFELCYGDGSIHGELTKEEVRTVYNHMVEFINS